MPGFQSEAEAIAKRTGEVMGKFMKYYAISLTQHTLRDMMDDVMTEVIGDLKEAATEVVGLKNEVVSKEEKAEMERIIGVKVTGRSKFTDVDSSQYTAYSVISCSISAKGSNLQSFQTRYRSLLSINKTMIHDFKDKFPEGQKFPPKRIFGNKEEKFLDSRQHELSDWITTAAKNPSVYKYPAFLQLMKLEKDDERAKNFEIFLDAFSKVCADERIWPDRDPSTYEDEGQGLQVLMIAISDREIFPKIEEKLLALPTGRSVALRAARNTLAQTIGKGVHKAWEASADKVKEMRTALHSAVESQVDKIKDVLKQIFAKIVPIMIEKLGKRREQVQEMAEKHEQQEKEKEAKAKEEKEYLPELGHFPVGKQMIENLLKEKHVLDSIKKLQAQVKDEFKLKDKLAKEADEIIRDTPDRDLQRVMEIGKDLVSGLAEFWLKFLDSLLTGVSLFLKVREDLEDKIVASGGVEAAKVEVEKAFETLKDGLRDFGLTLATIFFDLRNELRSWYCRNLSSETAAKVLHTIISIPQRFLNFLAQLLHDLKQLLPTALEKGNDEAVIREEYRKIFVDCSVKHFNHFLGHSWIVVRTIVADATKSTLVEKLSEEADRVIEEISGTFDAIPMPPGMELTSVLEGASDKVLDMVADKAVEFLRKRIEKAAFADDPAQ